MINTKHTPGLWHAIAVERKYHDEDGQIITVATVMADPHLAVARCHKIEDAQFIALACNAYEDMAKALQKMLAIAELCTFSGPDIDAAHALLVKAGIE